MQKKNAVLKVIWLMMQESVMCVLGCAVGGTVILQITLKSLAMKHTIVFEFPAGYVPSP
jgi:hypothetical protein